MFSLVRNAIREGHWAQCLFCKCARPTRKYANEEIVGKPWSKGPVDSIEPSGYCTYCESKGLRI
jgi:hypothetical protein